MKYPEFIFLRGSGGSDATNASIASGDTVTLTALAAAASLNKAATDYTDTWTVIGAGNF